MKKFELTPAIEWLEETHPFGFMRFDRNQYCPISANCNGPSPTHMGEFQMLNFYHIKVDTCACQLFNVTEDQCAGTNDRFRPDRTLNAFAEDEYAADAIGLDFP